MWYLPLSITLDVKRTRTTWLVSIRVQFWLKEMGESRKARPYSGSEYSAFSPAFQSRTAQGPYRTGQERCEGRP